MVCSFFFREYTEREVYVTLFIWEACICKHQCKLTEHECKLVLGRVLERSNDKFLSHVILADVNKYSMKSRL